MWIHTAFCVFSSCLVPRGPWALRSPNLVQLTGDTVVEGFLSPPGWTLQFRSTPHHRGWLPCRSLISTARPRLSKDLDSTYRDDSTIREGFRLSGCPALPHLPGYLDFLKPYYLVKSGCTGTANAEPPAQGKPKTVTKTDSRSEGSPCKPRQGAPRRQSSQLCEFQS